MEVDLDPQGALGHNWEFIRVGVVIGGQLVKKDFWEVELILSQLYFHIPLVLEFLGAGGVPSFIMFATALNVQVHGGCIIGVLRRDRGCDVRHGNVISTIILNSKEHLMKLL
ncbi:hypothetical protein ACS0TY_017972 [Phlomoides rotata]